MWGRWFNHPRDMVELCMGAGSTIFGKCLNQLLSGYNDLRRVLNEPCAKPDRSWQMVDRSFGPLHSKQCSRPGRDERVSLPATQATQPPTVSPQSSASPPSAPARRTTP